MTAITAALTQVSPIRLPIGRGGGSGGAGGAPGGGGTEMCANEIVYIFPIRPEIKYIYIYINNHRYIETKTPPANKEGGALDRLSK